MGCSHVCERSAGFHRLLQFLSKIHQRLFKSRSAAQRTHQKGRIIQVDLRLRKSFSEPERESLRSTDTDPFRCQRAIVPRDRCIWLRQRGSVITRRQRWPAASNSLFLKEDDTGGMQLRNPRFSMDCVTGLPKCQWYGRLYNAILMVVDRLAKEKIYIPSSDEDDGTNTEATARMLVQHVWSKHGLPTSVVSDRGPQFVSEMWKALCKILRIKA